MADLEHRVVVGIEADVSGAEPIVSSFGAIEESASKASSSVSNLEDTFASALGGQEKWNEAVLAAQYNNKNFAASMAETDKELAAIERSQRKAASAAEKLAQESDRAGRAVGGAGDSLRKANQAASLIRNTLLGLAGGFSIGKVIQEITRFQSVMSELKTVTGATGEELAYLSETAKSFGRTTNNSAAEAATGLLSLTKAGFSSAEAVAELDHAMNLADATSTGLAQTADILARTIQAFGMEASDSGKVADVLAVASKKAGVSLMEMGTALKMAGPVAKGYGLSLAETASAIGIMTKSSGSAMRAQMALSQTLKVLTDDSKRARDTLKLWNIDAEEMRKVIYSPNGLVKAMQMLHEAGVEVDDLNKILGTRMAAVTGALVSQADQFAKNTEEAEKSADMAKRYADVMNDNLAGDAKLAKAALAALAIELGDNGVSGLLRGGLQAITGFAQGLSGIVSETSSASGAMKAFNSIGLVLRNNLEALVDIGTIFAAMWLSKTIPSLIASSAGFKAAAAGVNALVTALKAGVGAYTLHASQAALAITESADMAMAMGHLSKAVTIAGQSLITFKGVAEATSVAMTGLGMAVKAIPFAGWVSILTTVATAVYVFTSNTTEAVETLDEFTGRVKASVDEFFRFGRATREFKLEEVQKELSDTVEKLDEATEAQKRLRASIETPIDPASLLAMSKSGTAMQKLGAYALLSQGAMSGLGGATAVTKEELKDAEQTITELTQRQQVLTATQNLYSAALRNDLDAVIQYRKELDRLTSGFDAMAEAGRKAEEEAAAAQAKFAELSARKVGAFEEAFNQYLPMEAANKKWMEQEEDLRSIITLTGEAALDANEKLLAMGYKGREDAQRALNAMVAGHRLERLEMSQTLDVYRKYRDELVAIHGTAKPVIALEQSREEALRKLLVVQQALGLSDEQAAAAKSALNKKFDEELIKVYGLVSPMQALANSLGDIRLQSRELADKPLNIGMDAKSLALLERAEQRMEAIRKQAEADVVFILSVDAEQPEKKLKILEEDIHRVTKEPMLLVANLDGSNAAAGLAAINRTTTQLTSKPMVIEAALNTEPVKAGVEGARRSVAALSGEKVTVQATMDDSALQASAQNTKRAILDLNGLVISIPVDGTTIAALASALGNAGLSADEFKEKMQLALEGLKLTQKGVSQLTDSLPKNAGAWQSLIARYSRGADVLKDLTEKQEAATVALTAYWALQQEGTKESKATLEMLEKLLINEQSLTEARDKGAKAIENQTEAMRFANSEMGKIIEHYAEMESADPFNGVREKLDPIGAKLRDLTVKLKEAQEEYSYLMSNPGEADRMGISMSRAAQQVEILKLEIRDTYREVEKTENRLRGIPDLSVNMADAITGIWEDFGRSLNATVTQMFLSAFKGMDEFKRGLRDVLKNLVASIASVFTQNTIIVPLVGKIVGFLGMGGKTYKSPGEAAGESSVSTGGAVGLMGKVLNEGLIGSLRTVFAGIFGFGGPSKGAATATPDADPATRMIKTYEQATEALIEAGREDTQKLDTTLRRISLNNGPTSTTGDGAMEEIEVTGKKPGWYNKDTTGEVIREESAKQMEQERTLWGFLRSGLGVVTSFLGMIKDGIFGLIKQGVNLVRTLVAGNKEGGDSGGLLGVIGKIFGGVKDGLGSVVGGLDKLFGANGALTSGYKMITDVIGNGYGQLSGAIGTGLDKLGSLFGDGAGSFSSIWKSVAESSFGDSLKSVFGVAKTPATSSSIVAGEWENMPGGLGAVGSIASIFGGKAEKVGDIAQIAGGVYQTGSTVAVALKDFTSFSKGFKGAFTSTNYQAASQIGGNAPASFAAGGESVETAALAEGSGMNMAMALKNIGAGIAGSIVGGLLAENFGKQENTTLLTTAGSVIGSIWGPLGTFLGGVIGGAVSGALGGNKKITEQGVALELTRGGVVDAEAYKYEKKAKSLFRGYGDPKYKVTDELEAADSSLSQGIQSVYMSLGVFAKNAEELEKLNEVFSGITMPKVETDLKRGATSDPVTQAAVAARTAAKREEFRQQLLPKYDTDRSGTLSSRELQFLARYGSRQDKLTERQSRTYTATLTDADREAYSNRIVNEWFQGIVVKALDAAEPIIGQASNRFLTLLGTFAGGINRMVDGLQAAVALESTLKLNVKDEYEKAAADKAKTSLQILLDQQTKVQDILAKAYTPKNIPKPTKEETTLLDKELTALEKAGGGELSAKALEIQQRTYAYDKNKLEMEAAATITNAKEWQIVPEKMSELAAELLNLKGAAVALLLTYDEVQKSMKDSIKGVRDSIEEGGMTPEALYQKRRTEFDTAVSSLRDARDPGEIAGYANTAISKLGEAFSLLDRSQQDALRPEFLRALDELQPLVDFSVNTGKEQVQNIAVSIDAAITDKISEAALQQRDAAVAFGASVTLFGRYVEMLTEAGVSYSYGGRVTTQPVDNRNELTLR